MRKIKSKGIACILSALLIMAGALLIGNPGSKVIASETATISEKVLSVKCQLSNDMTRLRIVTTIDEHEKGSYGNVGFEITFLGDDDAEQKSKEHKVKKVLKKIKSEVEGVEYEFSPKVFNTKSEWFATYTITQIPEAYRDNGIIIKPFVTMKGSSEKIYGQSRYLTMSDQTNGVVNLPVKGELTSPTVASATVQETYFDGTYTHVRVGADYASLPSISTYTVTDNGKDYTAKYRYLHSTVASDQSWYTESDADDKVIVTAGDMFGFQKLAEANNFADFTIYLGADIDLNPDWTAGSEAPANQWTPIGYYSGKTTAKKFAGVFDGNMHSISGVYMNIAYTQIGLFGEVNGATIQNLELKNSYISSSRNGGNGVGSIVGRLNGTLDTVKSSADVVLAGAKYAGGLVGDVPGGVSATIKNCWFAGTVSGEGSQHGTLLGGMNSSDKSTGTIENCLSTGTIDKRNDAGGLVGALVNKNELTITDSLYAGTFSEEGGTTHLGTIVGYVESTVTLTNVYARKDSEVATAVGQADTAIVNGTPQIFEATVLTGDAAYLNMNVDFYIEEHHEDGVWFAMASDHPVLTSFADKTNAVDLRQTQGNRTCWYDADATIKEFTLYTPADLRGFQKLAEKNNFEDTTIYLGTDIDLNPDWTVGSGVPANQWTPIGYYSGNQNAEKFAGMFDGNMHSISGVYMNLNATQIGLFGWVDGGTIQNLELKNSYISSTATGTGVGSVVGRLNGTLNTVKSSAVVESDAKYTGGMVGHVQANSGDVNVQILNCWFAGTVNATNSNGFHGTLLGGTDKTGTVNIAHCLSTGNISKRSNTGGLVGQLKDSMQTITDSLFAGTLEDVGETDLSNIGMVGKFLDTTDVDMSTVYFTEESGFNFRVGNAASNKDGKLEAEKLYLGDAAENTALTIYPEGQDSSSDGETKLYWWYASETHPILASFGSPTTYSKLKVATYNIGYCEKLGTDTTTQVLNQVASFISTNNIDVCILQEVNGGADQAKSIADQLGYTSVYQKADDHFLKQSIGIAIVSKYSVVGDPVAVEIDVEGQLEKRVLLQVMIDVNEDDKADTAVIGTHFDNQSLEGRSAAVTQLQEMVTSIGADTPIVFAGDLNEAYSSDATSINAISEFLTSTTAGRNANTVYSTEGTGYQLDYIFTNNHFKHGYASVKVPTITISDVECELSDHRPLVVNLYTDIERQ